MALGDGGGTFSQLGLRDLERILFPPGTLLLPVNELGALDPK